MVVKYGTLGHRARVLVLSRYCRCRACRKLDPRAAPPLFDPPGSLLCRSRARAAQIGRYQCQVLGYVNTYAFPAGSAERECELRRAHGVTTRTSRQSFHSSWLGPLQMQACSCDTHVHACDHTADSIEIKSSSKISCLPASMELASSRTTSSVTASTTALLPLASSTTRPAARPPTLQKGSTPSTVRPIAKIRLHP